MLILIWGNTIC